jgi:hypothetical protein
MSYIISIYHTKVFHAWRFIKILAEADLENHIMNVVVRCSTGGHICSIMSCRPMKKDPLVRSCCSLLFCIATTCRGQAVCNTVLLCITNTSRAGFVTSQTVVQGEKDKLKVIKLSYLIALPSLG